MKFDKKRTLLKIWTLGWLLKNVFFRWIWNYSQIFVIRFKFALWSEHKLEGKAVGISYICQQGDPKT